MLQPFQISDPHLILGQIASSVPADEHREHHFGICVIGVTPDGR
jgi:hypothetical protein